MCRVFIRNEIVCDTFKTIKKVEKLKRDKEKFAYLKKEIGDQNEDISRNI